MKDAHALMNRTRDTEPRSRVEACRAHVVIRIRKWRVSEGRIGRC